MKGQKKDCSRNNLLGLEFSANLRFTAFLVVTAASGVGIIPQAHAVGDEAQVSKVSQVNSKASGEVGLPLIAENQILIEGKIKSADLQKGEIVIEPIRFQNSSGRSAEIEPGKSKVIYLRLSGTNSKDSRSPVTDYYEYIHGEFLRVPALTAHGPGTAIRVIGENDPQGKASGLYASIVILGNTVTGISVLKKDNLVTNSVGLVQPLSSTSPNPPTTEAAQQVVVGRRGDPISLNLPSSSSSFSWQGTSQAVAEPGPSLGSFGLGRSFLSRSVYSNLADAIPLDTESLFDVGVSPEQHAELINSVCLNVYRRAHHQSSNSVPVIAKELTNLVNETLKKNSVDSPSVVLVEWLKAEAVCAYAISRFTYDTAQTDPSVTYQRQVYLGEPSRFLNSDAPMAVCNGYARFARDTSRAMGLNCQYVGGYFRLPGTKEAPRAAGHGWNLFRFSNGAILPADTTNGYSGGEQTRWDRVPHKVGWGILPRTPRAMELFCSMYYQEDDVPDRYGDSQNSLNLMYVSRESWLRASISGYQKLFEWYLGQDGNAVVNGY